MKVCVRVLMSLSRAVATAKRVFIYSTHVLNTVKNSRRLIGAECAIHGDAICSCS